MVVEEYENSWSNYDFWQICYTEEGYTYYLNQETGDSQWEDPRDSAQHCEIISEDTIATLKSGVRLSSSTLASTSAAPTSTVTCTS